MSVKNQSEYGQYYDQLHPEDMLDKILNMCLENSSFFLDKESVMDELGDICNVYQSLIIDKPSVDYEWPIVDNDVSKQVDGYIVNAEIMNTNTDSELYSYDTTRKIAEIVTDYELDDSIERVPPLSHSVGIAMTYLSESLSTVYSDFVSMDYSIADVNAEKVASALGDYTAIDWFQKPVVSKSLDNDRSRYIRDVWNYLLSGVQAGARILSIGGDCGSASRRSRDYDIDCLYFDEKMYETAKKERKRYMSHGIDYLYGVNFEFSKMDPSVWSVCTFNYYAEHPLLLELYVFFKDSMCQVWGILCSPDWDDLECVYSSSEYDSSNISQLPIDVVKANYHNYQILGRNVNKVALYTTHGRFEDVIIDYDEPWLHEVPISSLDRVLPKHKFKSTYLHSLCHTSLYIIETQSRSCFFSTALFPIKSYKQLESSVYIYTIKGLDVFDERNQPVFKLNHVGVKFKCDGFKIKVYRGPILLQDGTESDADYTVALDINSSGSYFKRRSLLESLGFRMYTYGNISSSYKRKWNDSFDTIQMSLIDLIDLIDDDNPVYTRIRDLMRLSSGEISKDYQMPFFQGDGTMDNRSYIRKNFASFPAVVVRNISYNPLLRKVVYCPGKHAFMLYRLNNVLSRDTFNTDKMVDFVLVKEHVSWCPCDSDNGFEDLDVEECDCPMRFTTQTFVPSGIPFTFVFLDHSFDVLDIPMNFLDLCEVSESSVDWIDESVGGGDW